MKFWRWIQLVFVFLLTAAAIHVWADDDDAKTFPNRMETTPSRPSGPIVVGNPAQPGSSGTGSLGPGAGSQMGAGIQIPLGGNDSHKSAPEEDSDKPQKSEDSDNPSK
jgi:hypothetical protein